MKKLLLMLLLGVFIFGVSYSSSYTDAIEKLAKRENISYKEAKKKYDKMMDNILAEAIKEMPKEPQGFVTNTDLFEELLKSVEEEIEGVRARYGKNYEENIPFFLGNTVRYYMSGITNILDYCDYNALQNRILEYNPFNTSNIVPLGLIDTENRKFTLGYAYYDNNNNLIAVFTRTAECKKYGNQFITNIIEVTLEFPNGKIYKNKEALDYMFGKIK